MKYKKTMKKRVFRLTESQIDRLSKRLLKESYLGIIMPEDTMCEIICKLKLAKYGSKGDVVKMIQHLLYANQYNTKYSGGGMKGDYCYKDYKECDGIFKNQTETAVKEFQKYAGIKVDGVVGYETWKAMCSKLQFTDSVVKDKFCLDCPCDDNFQNDFQDIDVFDPIKSIDSIDCEKLKKCVKDHILITTAPDYLGFEKCIGKEQKTDMDQSDWDNLNGKGYVKQCEWYNSKNEYIINCPDYLNCQSGPNKDMRYCNSKAIQSCIANGCTKATY
jgi:hypothetical protein